MDKLKERQEEENERQRTFGKMMTSQQKEVPKKNKTCVPYYYTICDCTKPAFFSKNI